MRGLLIMLLVGASALLGLQATQVQAQKAKAKATYKLVVPESVDVNVGFAHDVEIAIAPAEGMRVDQHGPLKIDLRSADEDLLVVKKRTLRRRDAVDARSSAPRFFVTAVGKSVGQGALQIRYSFWLCRKKICYPIRGEANVPVQVSLPPAQDAGATVTVPGPSSTL